MRNLYSSKHAATPVIIQDFRTLTLCVVFSSPGKKEEIISCQSYGLWTENETQQNMYSLPVNFEQGRSSHRTVILYFVKGKF